MKEKERIDIVLRGLYEDRAKPMWHSPSEFLPGLTPDEEFRIAKWLGDQGYVQHPIGSGKIKIDTEGIMYCEEDSQSFPGEPVIAITNVIITDSPNASVEITVAGQVLYPNLIKIQSEIDSIKSDLVFQKQINSKMVSMIGEFLDDVSSRIDDRKRIPLLSWEWLSRTDNLLSMGERLWALHKLIYPNEIPNV